MRASGPASTLALALALTRGLVVERHRVHQVDLARQQRRNARRGVGDRREVDLVEIVDRLVPPIRVALPYSLHAGLVTDQHERPGAVGVQRRIGRRRRVHRRRLGRAVRLRPGLGENAPGLPLIDQQRSGLLEQHVDGIVIDLHELSIAGYDALEVRAGAGDAFGREDDVVGGKVLAFVELDAFAQMKAPVQRIERFPAGGETRFELHVRAATHEALIDGFVDADAETLVNLIGIDGLELALESKPQGLGVRGGRQRRKHEHCRERSCRQDKRFRLPHRHVALLKS